MTFNTRRSADAATIISLCSRTGENRQWKQFRAGSREPASRQCKTSHCCVFATHRTGYLPAVADYYDPGTLESVDGRLLPR